MSFQTHIGRGSSKGLGAFGRVGGVSHGWGSPMVRGMRPTVSKQTGHELEAYLPKRILPELKRGTATKTLSRVTK